MAREDKLRKAIEEYTGIHIQGEECINATEQCVAFADGANWQYHQFIEKACEWLEDCAVVDIEEFKKAMED